MYVYENRTGWTLLILKGHFSVESADDESGNFLFFSGSYLSTFRLDALGSSHSEDG